MGVYLGKVLAFKWMSSEEGRCKVDQDELWEDGYQSDKFLAGYLQKWEIVVTTSSV